jgi:transcriptional regulator with XRE-family HTH domain
LGGEARSGTADSSEPSIGAVLHGLRRRAGLTGQELGRRVGMSQAKISRIETGSGSVTPADVGRLAVELGADPEVLRRLTEQAERGHNRLTDWRQTGGVVATMQRDIARLEADTREFRVFQPAVVIGLMQTSEYARAVLTSAHAIRTGIYHEGGATTVPEAVSARVQRQESLVNPAKRFAFVMTEAVLRNRLVPPEHMLAQIDRIRQVARLPNVSLRIIPSDGPMALPPYHGFEVLDDKCVFLDAFNTSMLTRGREDVQLYRHVFDLLEESATSVIAPLLDHYRRRYLDEIRESA